MPLRSAKQYWMQLFVCIRTLVPGLLEHVYETCVAHELRASGFKVETQVPLPVYYDGIKMEAGYRIDLLVEDLVVVEVKSIEALAPVHHAQHFHI